MIPRTFPSILGALGETKMVVYVLPSVSDLQAWKDYIPVKGITTENTAVQNTYANDGYQVMSPLEDISTKQAWKDYIPVFEDASYTKAWSTDAGGYIPASGLFSVYSLFSNNEQGVWYDPSDLTTLFQDAAGTTPVTDVEQPVGLMLDKSKGLVLGSDLIVNGAGTSLTGWTNFNNWWVVSSGRFYHAPSSAYNEFSQSLPIAPGFFIIEFGYQVVSASGTVQWFYENALGSVTVFNINSGSGNVKHIIRDGIRKLGFTRKLGNSAEFYVDNISVRELPGNHAYQTTSANRPTLSARYNQFVGTETLATQNVPTVATTYTLRFEGTGSITLSGTKTGTYSAGTHSLTGVTVGTLTATVTGTVSKADLRVANDGVGIPAYQRVNTATDYDTVGFPKYLSFNGSSSAMMTNTITPGTDKAQVFAGVRKLAAMGAYTPIVEFSATIDANNGVINFWGPGSTTQFGFTSKGTNVTAAQTTDSNYVAPTTVVLSGIGSISGDSAILRVNGTQAASSTADQGTGNYLAYPLYIGARGAGTASWFNGRVYSMIVRFGSNMTTAQITNTEKYVNSKTKAY